MLTFNGFHIVVMLLACFVAARVVHTLLNPLHYTKQILKALRDSDPPSD